jgi:hypothetical protein
MATNSLPSSLLPRKQILVDVNDSTPSSTNQSPENPALSLTNDANHHTSRPFREIGFGFCGSVWAIEGPGINTCAIKREDGAKTRSVHKDFIIH